MTVASMPIEVGARALDALVGALEAAEEIAAADDDRDLDAEFGRGLEIGGDASPRSARAGRAYPAPSGPRPTV